MVVEPQFLLKPRTGMMFKYNILDPITSASTTTSPSIWTEPRDRNDTQAKVDAMSTTAMMSNDLTPTLLPKNENGKILFGSGDVVILV